MGRSGRCACRLVFAPGLWRLIGDFSRLAGSHARVCVYARVKRVPVRRLRGGAEIVPGVFRFAGLSAGVSGRLPGGLAFPVSVAPACRWLPLCVLTGKCGNFGFLFGIKFLFLWLCFRIQTGIFFWKPPEPARRVVSPARSGCLVSGRSGKVARRADGRMPARAFPSTKKKVGTFCLTLRFGWCRFGSTQQPAGLKRRSKYNG